MIAGVVIEDWKLPIFERHLNAAGFKHTVYGGITIDTLTLKIICEWAHELKPIVEAANAECATVKREPNSNHGQTS